MRPTPLKALFVGGHDDAVVDRGVMQRDNGWRIEGKSEYINLWEKVNDAVQKEEGKST